MFQSRPKRWKWPFMEIKREWGEVGSLLITGRRGGFGLFWWGWLSQLGRLDVRKLPDGESDIPKHFSCKAFTCWAPFTFGGERIILFNLFSNCWKLLCEKYSFTSFALPGIFPRLSSPQVSQMWTLNISMVINTCVTRYDWSVYSVWELTLVRDETVRWKLKMTGQARLSLSSSSSMLLWI